MRDVAKQSLPTEVNWAVDANAVSYAINADANACAICVTVSGCASKAKHR